MTEPQELRRGASRVRAAGGTVAALAIGAVATAAGSHGGLRLGGVAVFALCALLALLVNWAAFIPAAIRRTERFYDLTGTGTYIAVVVLALVGGSRSPTSLLLAALIAVWAIRLGWFLVSRIRRDGTDRRFDALKSDPVLFLTPWTLQALWILLTAGAALAGMTSDAHTGIGVPAILGALLWCLGFGIEASADAQKRAFRAERSNRDGFITTGWWAWSRHPNYFGEITAWTGIAIVAAPALSGWRYVTLISPFFVAVLLTGVSGIPLLEASGQRRWGDDAAYRAYLERTPVLVPRPPKNS